MFLARPVAGGPRCDLSAATPIRSALLAAILGLALALAAPPAVDAAPVVRDHTGVETDSRSPDPTPALTRISDQARPPVTEPAAPSSATGQLVADFALGFQGYPYAWAGNTPAGFDCSGFTQYVVLNTLGVDIGHAVEGQPAGGAFVDWGAWLPGDVVFFQNTYRAGISHAGIYVGDGLFIHAENEGTGVVVTSMYSDYYGSRYWGAIRVA